MGEEHDASFVARLETRFEAWRGDRRIVAAACACIAVAAAVAWWRAGTSSADVPSTTVTSEPAATVSSTTVRASELIVNVVGAVRAPGVVRIPAGARVVDAIVAAGGATADADLVRLNLAAPVADGARIAVPKVGEPAPALDPTAVSGAGNGSPGAAGTTGGSTPTGPINVNTATEAELETLPGIGPATAAAIVADREAHGPFASVEDLSRVRGIGPAKLEQLADLVTV